MLMLLIRKLPGMFFGSPTGIFQIHGHTSGISVLFTCTAFQVLGPSL